VAVYFALRARNRTGGAQPNLTLWIEGKPDTKDLKSLQYNNPQAFNERRDTRIAYSGGGSVSRMGYATVGVRIRSQQAMALGAQWDETDDRTVLPFAVGVETEIPHPMGQVQTVSFLLTNPSDTDHLTIGAPFTPGAAFFLLYRQAEGLGANYATPWDRLSAALGGALAEFLFPTVEYLAETSGSVRTEESGYLTLGPGASARYAVQFQPEGSGGYTYHPVVLGSATLMAPNDQPDHAFGCINLVAY
jgi:hypothetical protein